MFLTIERLSLLLLYRKLQFTHISVIFRPIISREHGTVISRTSPGQMEKSPKSGSYIRLRQLKGFSESCPSAFLVRKINISVFIALRKNQEIGP